MPEQFLTVEQAASRLQVHPITVRRHLRRGTLRGVKRGNLWRVPESALEESPPAPISPLVQALAMVRERDARAGDVPIRRDGDSAADVRAVREAQTP
jgi:excisionase family DNA binding protein